MTRVVIAQFELNTKLDADQVNGKDQAVIDAAQLEIDDLVERLLGIDPEGEAVELSDQGRDYGDDIGTLRTISWMLSSLTASGGKKNPQSVDLIQRALATRGLLIPGVVKQFGKNRHEKMLELVNNALYVNGIVTPGLNTDVQFDLDSSIGGDDAIIVPGEFAWAGSEIHIGYRNDESGMIVISPGHVANMIEEIKEFTWSAGRFQAIMVIVMPDEWEISVGFDRPSQSIMTVIAGGDVVLCSTIGTKIGDGFPYYQELTSLIGEPYSSTREQMTAIINEVRDTKLIEIPDFGEEEDEDEDDD